MESILVLTHVDENGAALTKASLEAVTAALELASHLSATQTIGIVGAGQSVAADAVASAGARLLAVSGEAFAQPRYPGQTFCAASLAQRSSPLRRSLPPRESHYRSGSCHFALCPGCRRCGASARRIHRHAHYFHRRCPLHRGYALGLSPARL